MGAAASAPARDKGAAAGGREDGYGRDGNYWDPEEGDESGGDGLLPVTHAEVSATQAKYEEIRRRNADALASAADIQYGVISLRTTWDSTGVSVADRMAALRKAHMQRLIEWENDQQRQCAHCQLTIEDEVPLPCGDGLYCHNGCYDAYREDMAPPCEHCGEKIVPAEGKFSGSKAVLRGGVVVHAECHVAYVKTMGEPCAHCGTKLEEGTDEGPGVQPADRFMVAVDGEKVHAHCHEQYAVQQGLVCLQCGLVFEAAVKPVEKKVVTDLCYYCSKPGHWKQDCPQLLADNPELRALPPQQRAQAAMAVPNPETIGGAATAGARAETATQVEAEAAAAHTQQRHQRQRQLMMQRMKFGSVGYCHVGSCAREYVREHATKCLHCSKPILPGDAADLPASAPSGEHAERVSQGAFYSGDQLRSLLGGKGVAVDGEVHVTCFAAYRRSVLSGKSGSNRQLARLAA